MNKIIINDKEYVLSDELVEKIAKELTVQEKTKNLFERNVGDRYYYIDASDDVSSFIDTEGATDNAFYSAGNYCRERGLMEQRALHEKLSRLLWRYSETHGGDAPWDGIHIHCMLTYSIGKNKVDITSFWQKKMHGCVYFKDVATAQAAIEEVVKPFLTNHPDFEW